MESGLMILKHYALSSGNYLSTFRDNLSVTSSKGEESKRCFWIFLILEPGRAQFSYTSAAEAWNHAISINVDLIQTVVVHQLPWSANLLHPTPPARRHSWKVAAVRFVGTVRILNVQPLLTQVCWWPHKGPLRVIFPSSDLRSPCKDDGD